MTRSQNFIREATSADEAAKYLPKTMNYPLPDANVMWRTGPVENPLITCVGKSGGDADGVPFFNTLAALFSSQIRLKPILNQIKARVTPTGEKPLCSYYTQNRVHRRDHFHMKRTCAQITGEESSHLLRSSTNGEVKGAKGIGPGVGRGRRWYASLSIGSSAQIDWKVVARNNRFVTHLDSIESSEERSFRIQ